MRYRTLGSAVVSRASVRFVVVGLAAVWLLVVGLSAGAATFEEPDATGWTVWQAEEAEREGSWEVSAPDAGGERYVQPASGAEPGTLTFSFDLQEPTIIRVRPVWWRTGEQKLARRFPYPLVRQPGPDAIDFVGTTVFCTAPAAGRVVAVDVVTEAVLGSVEVGGYLTDLVADREAGKIYVADALGDRVVVIDAKTRAIVSVLAIPGSPWSLALNGGMLYVACRDDKRVVAIDTTAGKVRQEVALVASPINLELIGTPPTQLAVRFQQQAFDVFSLEALENDEQQFMLSPWLAWSVEKPPPSCWDGELECDCQWPQSPGPHQLALVSTEDREQFDVSAVTRGPASADCVSRFPDNPGPCAMATVEEPEPYELLQVFFTSPSRGRIGVLDPKSGSVETFLDVGGYPIDLVPRISPPGGKFYIADPAGERVLVVDAKARKVEKEVKVPGEPWRLAFVGEVAVQRPENWPPTSVNRLYVWCRATRDLAVVDLAQGLVVKRVPLPREPRAIKFVDMPPTGWWPLMADDRIPFALRPRVAVELSPLTLDLETLRPAVSQLDPPEEGPRRWKVHIAAGSAGEEKMFFADNTLVLGVGSRPEEERWVDLSAAADPQRMAPRPLAEKETPGTISVSLDAGREFDWARGIWVEPESKLFLVNDSEEFWRHNAPSFRLEPGRHVLRIAAHSEFARLDAVAVRRSLEPDVRVVVVPEPWEIHSLVPTPTYQGVFYDEEPVRFTLEVSNRGVSQVELDVSCSLRNYMEEVVDTSQPARIQVKAGETRSYLLEFAPRDVGRFTLAVKCESPEAPRGVLVRDVRFLRLPKLEHPRLFWRASEEDEIRARIAQYPDLFRRYGEWVERMVGREGRFPERFLPPGPTAGECAACAPADVTDPDEAQNRYGWRNYEVGWRILALQFADRFLEPRSAPLQAKIKALRSAEETDEYVMYHHHGPFFPGATASLVDLAPDDLRDSLRLREQFANSYGDMNVLPWTLVTLEEPLTPEERGMIYEIMTWENNAERYFATHRGKRGGTWWLDPYTSCHCPMHGYTLSFLMLRNFFGEPRLFEKPIFSGYLTFHHYADPIRDNRKLQPVVGGPGGEPWRWIFSSLAGHPLEKRFYDWEEWVETMAGPLAGNERGAVDRLMALKGRALTGPIQGHADHFVSGVSVPVALALGWYDPEAPEVESDELPPTAVFEVEGWVPMRSGWGDDATEVTFVSGVREHTTRHKPNHFTIVKGGEYLIGTPALETDDGNNVAAWGNTVVVGDEWEKDWRLNLEHPRDGEHLVINRFSQGGFTYIGRDERLIRYQPAEDGWGGGLNLHGHTETLFMNEGRLLAYQTWPELDYAAGDASNAWSLEQVKRAERQLVFVKPDVVVIYDRVELGPEAGESRWIAATGPELEIEGSAFRIGSGSEFLRGRVLLPEGAVVSNPEVLEPGWDWKDQKLLEIRHSAQGKSVEYLVVMRVGGEDAPSMLPELIDGDDEVGLRLRSDDRMIEVRFDRDGPCGGEAIIAEGGRSTRYQLRPGIVDSYSGWRADPRWQRWTTEPRFGFVMPAGDHLQQ